MSGRTADEYLTAHGQVAFLVDVGSLEAFLVRPNDKINNLPCIKQVAKLRT